MFIICGHLDFYTWTFGLTEHIESTQASTSLEDKEVLIGASSLVASQPEQDEDVANDAPKVSFEGCLSVDISTWTF